MHVKTGPWPHLPNHGGRWKKRLYEALSGEEYLRLLNETLILRVRKDSGGLRRGKHNKPPKQDKSKRRAGASSQMLLPFLVTSKNRDLFYNHTDQSP